MPEFKKVSRSEKLTKKDRYASSDNKMQAIDVINAYNLNFNLGNIVKYILRLGKKDDEILELEKARDYINFEIDRIKKERDVKHAVNVENLSNE